MNQIDIISSILGKKKAATRTNPVDRHVWSIEEENLVLDLYFSKSNEKEIVAAIEKTELKLSSVKMKLMNIQYLDTGLGLSRVSGLTTRLFEQRRLNG